MSVDEYVKVLSVSEKTFADSEFLTVSCIAMALCSATGYSELRQELSGWHCRRLIRISRGA